MTKKVSKKQQKIWDEDSELIEKKKLYFVTIKHENIPFTVKLTEKLDKLEKLIFARMLELTIKTTKK